MIYNFIYLVGKNTPSFRLIHYIVIKSWISKHPKSVFKLWTNVPPTYSPWYWRLREEFPNLIIEDPQCIIDDIPDKYKGPFRQDTFIAHQADLLRLYLIYNYGGVYVDLDMICLRSFDDIFEGAKPIYPCELSEDHHFEAVPNGFFYAPQNSRWIAKLIDLYGDYNPESWNETSIGKPTELYLEDPSQITIIPAGLIDPITWRYDDWQDFFMHDLTARIDDCWTVHLSESITKDFLRLVDITHIMTVNTNFTRVVRSFVEKYWDSENNISKISKYE